MQGKRHDRVVEMRLCFFSGKVGDYKVPFKSTRKCLSTKCDKDWDEICLMNDDEIYHLFYPHTFRPRNRFAPVDYSYVHSELKKVGVTEMLLWEEYCEKCNAQGISHCCYATFANGYKRFIADKNYTSHIEHKPGVTLEVDWSGPTMSYMDPDKQEQQTAYLFVAAFPYSQYTYVEAAASMNQSDWLSCNVHMLEFFGGTPVRIVCDNLKTGVIKHPKHGEVVLNDSYLSFAEHYQVAIMPAQVKKPKQKASVEGAVGKIARKIIGMLRNETFHSIEGLNSAIRKVLDRLNDKPFQKRNGSRKTIYELEEKPYLRTLPMLPFEICEWSYNHKVGPNSHIWFHKGQYSVPSSYINKYVDVQYNSSLVCIYASHQLVAEHKRIPTGIRNAKRTEMSHLPYPIYTPDTMESTLNKAEAIGNSTRTVIGRLYDNAKVKEQALVDARTVLDIAGVYGKDILETACSLALKDFHLITYNTLMPYVKRAAKNRKNDLTKKNVKDHKQGIVRGADYYREDGKNL